MLSPHSPNSLKQLGNTSLDEILREPSGPNQWYEITLTEPAHKVFEITGRSVQSQPANQDWVLVLRDVTLERKQQEWLQTQERLATVGRLAAGIAHDFKNILTVISAYSQLLQTRPDHPRREKHLDVIREQTEQGANLIEQILDFSRRSKIERRPTDMVKLVENLVSVLRRTMPANIGIKLEAESGAYVINADKARLQQMLMNLAINARDAMLDGGVLHFALSRRQPPPDLLPELGVASDHWINVCVADTGRGIAPDVLPYIFEPFYTTKAMGKGTGLGLAQVYGIVKQHGGEITVGGSPTLILLLPPAGA